MKENNYKMSESEIVKQIMLKLSKIWNFRQRLRK